MEPKLLIALAFESERMNEAEISQLDPTGMIVVSSQLNELAKRIGKSADRLAKYARIGDARYTL